MAFMLLPSSLAVRILHAIPLRVALDCSSHRNRRQTSAPLMLDPTSIWTGFGLGGITITVAVASQEEVRALWGRQIAVSRLGGQRVHTQSARRAAGSHLISAASSGFTPNQRGGQRVQIMSAASRTLFSITDADCEHLLQQGAIRVVEQGTFAGMVALRRGALQGVHKNTELPAGVLRADVRMPKLSGDHGTAEKTTQACFVFGPPRAKTKYTLSVEDVKDVLKQVEHLAIGVNAVSVFA